MKQLIIFLWIVAAAACSNRNAVPNDILSLDSMRSVLKDVVAVDAYSEQYIQNDSLIKDKTKANQELLEAVFSLHRTNRAAFKTSLDFYESRPDLGKKIFDSLTAYANRHKTDLYVPLSKPAKKPGAGAK